MRITGAVLHCSVSNNVLTNQPVPFFLLHVRVCHCLSVSAACVSVCLSTACGYEASCFSLENVQRTALRLTSPLASRVFRSEQDKASLIRAILRSYKKDIILNLMLVTIYIFFAVVTPVYFLRQIIRFVQQGDEPVLKGLGLVLGLVVGECLR